MLVYKYIKLHGGNAMILKTTFDNSKINVKTRYPKCSFLKARVNVQCDECQKEYETAYRNRLNNFIKHNNDLCTSCILKKQYSSGARTSIFKEMNIANTGKTLEERFGKEKADLTKSKMSDANSGTSNSNYGGKYSKGFAEDHLYTGGKTYEELYGVEKATSMKDNLSNKFRGELNPMFGKPSPKGSGNGWSGHYKDVYFRSLLELRYLIYLTENKIHFENGELKKNSIPYVDFDGTNRNYFPDFVLDDGSVIEIKPKNLINSANNKCKFMKATQLFGSKFIILTEEDIPVVTIEEYTNLFESGALVFDDRYKEKFKTLVK
jgi:hypothetical protein